MAASRVGRVLIEPLEQQPPQTQLGHEQRSHLGAEMAAEAVVVVAEAEAAELVVRYQSR